MFLYTALFLCAIVIGAGVYRYDLYDREPLPLVVLATFMGAGLMFIAGKCETGLLSGLGSVAAIDWKLSMAAAAAGFEESAKLLVVVLIALMLPRFFNDPMDGLIYGAFAGLGAAIEESLYMLDLASPPPFLPPTEPIRLLGHLVMGGIGAAGLGLARVHPRRAVPIVGACFVGAVALHFAWDVVAFSAAARGRMRPLHTAAAVGMMLAGLVGFLSLVARASRHSRRAFAPDSSKRLFAWPFSRLFPDR